MVRRSCSPAAEDKALPDSYPAYRRRSFKATAHPVSFSRNSCWRRCWSGSLPWACGRGRMWAPSPAPPSAVTPPPPPRSSATAPPAGPAAGAIGHRLVLALEATAPPWLRKRHRDDKLQLGCVEKRRKWLWKVNPNKLDQDYERWKRKFKIHMLSMKFIWVYGLKLFISSKESKHKHLNHHLLRILVMGVSSASVCPLRSDGKRRVSFRSWLAHDRWLRCNHRNHGFKAKYLNIGRCFWCWGGGGILKTFS